MQVLLQLLHFCVSFSLDLRSDESLLVSGEVILKKQIIIYWRVTKMLEYYQVMILWN